MVPPERVVLIGVDGSKFSEEAFNWYKDNYAFKTDKILLYHCVFPSSLVSAPRGLVTNPEKDYGLQLKKLQEEARVLEAKFMHKCQQNNLSCSWRTIIGNPSTHLVSAVQQEKADLIVIGTRGLNLLRRTLIGSVSNYITQHSNIPALVVPCFVIAKEFNPKKILILKKLTRYEFSKITHKNLSENELKHSLQTTGSDYEGLLVRHKTHYQKMNNILSNIEEHKVDIRVVDRFSYNREAIDWADLIVTAGGDGTFLLGASRITDDKPIVGINTDPLRSEGYLCMPRRFSNDLGAAIKHMFSGKFEWLWRQRISVTMSGSSLHQLDNPIELHELQIQFPEHRFMEHVREGEETAISHKSSGTNPAIELPFKALNEVFIGESLSARASYYELSVDDSNSQKQKSSGVTACTGTGSSSWSFHINHLSEHATKALLELAQRDLGSSCQCGQLADPTLVRAVCQDYNSSLCFSPEEARMAYTIRDPIKNKIFHVAHPRGFANKMTIKSRMWDAHVVIDGGLSYRFNDGAVAKLEIDPRHALRCLSLHAH